MKKGIILVCIALVAVILFAIVAFYVTPYIKANNCITYANKNLLNYEISDSWISMTDMKKLQIVDEETIQGDDLITTKTKAKCHLHSLNKISFIFDINVTVHKNNSDEVITRLHQKKEIVFEFARFQWSVKSVVTK